MANTYINWPKIAWGKNQPIVDDYLGHDPDGDLVVGCWMGEVSEQMVKNLKSKIDARTAKTLVLANTISTYRLCEEYGINVILAHKDLIEVKVDLYNIIDVEKEYDIICTSRDDKRLGLSAYCKNYKVCSVTKDSIHTQENEEYPFSYKNYGWLDEELRLLINKSKYGYLVGDIDHEMKTIIEYWLCGIPVITNFPSKHDGRAYHCLDGITHVEFNSEGLIPDHKPFDSAIIRNHCLSIIKVTRMTLNSKIDSLGIDPKFKVPTL